MSHMGTTEGGVGPIPPPTETAFRSYQFSLPTTTGAYRDIGNLTNTFTPSYSFDMWITFESATGAQARRYLVNMGTDLVVPGTWWEVIPVNLAALDLTENYALEVRTEPSFARMNIRVRRLAGSSAGVMRVMIRFDPQQAWTPTGTTGTYTSPTPSKLPSSSIIQYKNAVTIGRYPLTLGRLNVDTNGAFTGAAIVAVEGGKQLSIGGGQIKTNDTLQVNPSGTATRFGGVVSVGTSASLTKGYFNTQASTSTIAGFFSPSGAMVTSPTNGQIWHANDRYYSRVGSINTVIAGQRYNQHSTFTGNTNPTTAAVINTPVPIETSWLSVEQWGFEQYSYLTYSGLTGTFAVGLTVTGSVSLATGIIVADTGSVLTIKAVSGAFSLPPSADTISDTGGASASLVKISGGVINLKEAVKVRITGNISAEIPNITTFPGYLEAAVAVNGAVQYPGCFLTVDSVTSIVNLNVSLVRTLNTNDVVSIMLIQKAASSGYGYVVVHQGRIDVREIF